MKRAWPAPLSSAFFLFSSAVLMGCTGDDFTAPSGPGAAGSAASAGATSFAGASGAGQVAGGRAGAAGVAGAAPNGGQGGSGGQQTGSSGKAGSAGQGSSGGSAGAAGVGGSGGVGGGSGNGGSAGAPLPAIGPVSMKIFVGKDCSGDSYKNDDATYSLPQGAGEVCVALTGSFLMGDVVKIDGDILPAVATADGRSVVWTVPHGGGPVTRVVAIEVLRGNETVKLSASLTPRTVAATGNDSLGRGTVQKPWKTLQKALAGAKNDAIVLAGDIDPGLPDPTVKAYHLPTGASISPAEGANASLRPLVPFALHDGASIAKISLDCASVIGPCIQPVEGGSTVEDVVLTAKEGAIAVLEPGVKITVIGGKITSPAPFLHTGPGATLALKRVTAVPGEGICKDGLHVTATEGLAAPILEMAADGPASVIDGFNSCAGVWLEGGLQANVQNLLVSNSGTQKGGPALVAFGGKSGVALRDLIIQDAVGTGVALIAGTMTVERVRVVRAAGRAINFEQGDFVVRDVEISDAGTQGIWVGENARVDAGGKIGLSWAPSAVSIPAEAATAAGMTVLGSFRHSLGSPSSTLLIDGAPYVSLRVNGTLETFGSKDGSDGLQIRGARSSAVVFGGTFNMKTSFGRIDVAHPPSLEVVVLDARAGAGNASFSDTAFSVDGKMATVEGVSFRPVGIFSNNVGSDRLFQVNTLAPAPTSYFMVMVPPEGNAKADVLVSFSYSK